jgi:2-oxoglutarate ferredoxin oxidoreductase subunit delta
VSKLAKANFEKDLCKGCELCRTACPKGLIRMADNINAMGYHYAIVTDVEKCSGCGLCVLMCPDLVISVGDEVEK